MLREIANKKKMNCELQIVPAVFLSRLNNIIVQLRTQLETIGNDMMILHDLRKLYYDLRDAIVSNKASQDPSTVLKLELDAIYKHLISTLKKLRSRQKKRLADLHSSIFEEELENPRVDTPMKSQLKIFVARVVLLIDGINILLI